MPLTHKYKKNYNVIQLHNAMLSDQCNWKSLQMFIGNGDSREWETQYITKFWMIHVYVQIRNEYVLNMFS